MSACVFLLREEPQTARNRPPDTAAPRGPPSEIQRQAKVTAVLATDKSRAGTGVVNAQRGHGPLARTAPICTPDDHADSTGVVSAQRGNGPVRYDPRLPENSADSTLQQTPDPRCLTGENSEPTTGDGALTTTGRSHVRRESTGRAAGSTRTQGTAPPLAGSSPNRPLPQDPSAAVAGMADDILGSVGEAPAAAECGDRRRG